MPDYIIKSDAKQTSTLGKVKVLVEQVVGAPSQEAITQAVEDYIEAHPGSLSPLSPAVKSALLQIAEKVAYIDEHGKDYYDALDAALSAKALLQITAVYTQSGTVYTTDTLDSLKSDLVVTAYYDDGTTGDVTSACTLSGTLTEGTSTITVTYQGLTDTFDVTVSQAPQIPEGYTAIEYVQATGGASSAYNTTGVTLASADSAEIRAGFMTTANQYSSSGGYIVGCKQSSSGNTVGFGVLVKQDQTYVGAFDGTLCSIQPAGGSSMQGNKYDVIVTKSPTGLTVTDGTNSNATTGTPRSMYGSLYIFSISSTVPFTGRIYYLHIYVNGELKAKLIPCKRNSDNAVGFWDAVQEEFRTDNRYTAGPNL